MISVIFTCKGRPALTELCLRRLVELMPEPYELFICYDGTDVDYMIMLTNTLFEMSFVNYELLTNTQKESRFSLINRALEKASGEYFMHVENDFYWVDASCLDTALNAFHRHPDIDYIRFEYLPFTDKNFYTYANVDDKEVWWMKDGSPYRFTFNPHIRKFKYPTDEPFKTRGFIKQPEQHHNDGYKYNSACMTGDNWRHLGVYAEGGHLKPYYGERFFNERGRNWRHMVEVMKEFDKVTENTLYRELFRKYLNDNGNKHSP